MKPPKKSKRRWTCTPLAVAENKFACVQTKTLAGLILALSLSSCNCCFATNEFFAGTFQRSSRTIQRWLAELKKNGVIWCEYKRHSRTRVTRIIHLVHPEKPKRWLAVPTDRLRERNLAAVFVASYCASMRDLAVKSGRGFPSFSVAEIAERCGMKLSAARRACKAACDFEWLAETWSDLPKPRGFATSTVRYLAAFV